MRSLETAGNLINSVFAAHGSGSVGAIVVTVANLYALENLHGRAEHNQALFTLAARLRNTLPQGAQMCRLGPDVFLLLLRRSTSSGHLFEMAQRLRDRLGQPLSLGSGQRPSEVHLGAHQWVPELGIGVLAVPPEANRAAAVNTARSMSRTALTYPSRIAGAGAQPGEVVEVAARPATA
jgi:GGDEF domain-containing protein